MVNFEYKNMSVNITKMDKGEYMVSISKPFRRDSDRFYVYASSMKEASRKVKLKMMRKH